MENPEELSGERVRQQASESVRAGIGIQERVHDLTLAALSGRRFDSKAVRETVRAVTEGIALGAESSRAEVRQSLADAFRGMDEALRKSAEAGQTALRQLVATGRGFTDHELKDALASLQRIEKDLVDTLAQVTEAASERVRPELRTLLEEARRGGTATGRQVASTLAEFAQRASIASIEVTLAGIEAAGEVGARFAQVASGVLAGIADALRKPAAEAQEKKPG
jgi:hypothetical protein